MLPQHAIADYNSLQLAEIVDNADPDSRGRVRVRIHATQMECWAPVVTPSAGAAYGIGFLPKVGELVVIAFVSGDLPLVLGSIWSGQNNLPEQAEPHENRYSISTPAGNVLLFDDENGPKMELKTRAGNSLTITDEGGGEIKLERGGQTVTLGTSDVEINATGRVTITSAAGVTIDAPQVTVNAGMATFSGVVQCQTLIATAVVSSSYTPGAGNVW